MTTLVAVSAESCSVFPQAQAHPACVPVMVHRCERDETAIVGCFWLRQ
jgi:hypothetical protein